MASMKANAKADIFMSAIDDVALALFPSVHDSRTRRARFIAFAALLFVVVYASSAAFVQFVIIVAMSMAACLHSDDIVKLFSPLMEGKPEERRFQILSDVMEKLDSPAVAKLSAGTNAPEGIFDVGAEVTDSNPSLCGSISDSSSRSSENVSDLATTVTPKRKTPDASPTTAALPSPKIIGRNHPRCPNGEGICWYCSPAKFEYWIAQNGRGQRPSNFARMVAQRDHGISPWKGRLA